MKSHHRRRFLQRLLAISPGLCFVQSHAFGMSAHHGSEGLSLSGQIDEQGNEHSNESSTELFAHRFESNSAGYFTTGKNSAGQFSIHQLNQQGQSLQSFDLPKRGHSFAALNSQWLVAIGRRPANYFLAFNFETKKSYQITARPDRRFYGHGVFSKSNPEQDELLYLTENNLTTGEGVIGIYSVRENFKCIGEIPTYGIGPHDIQFDSNHDYLIVANGGIKTHPATGRKKLNVPTMQSSLAFINPSNGKLIKKYQLPETYQFNSIRHIAKDSQNNIYIALQNQSVEHEQCLIAIYHHQNQTIEPCQIPTAIDLKLNQYIGDICLDKSEKYFLATSPKGNLALLFKNDGQYLDAIQMDDVCGVEKANQDNSFFVSTGKGTIVNVTVNPNSEKLQAMNLLQSNDQAFAWDNHIVSSI